MKPERWQRIEQLYHACSVTPARRTRGLAGRGLCCRCPLRAEVEQLLAMDAAAGSFLAAPALEMEAKQLAAERTP